MSFRVKLRVKRWKGNQALDFLVEQAKRDLGPAQETLPDALYRSMQQIANEPPRALRDRA